MSNDDRAVKLYRINLDQARSGEENIGSGNFIQIVDASSNSAIARISTSQNRNDAYLKFKKNAYLSLDRDFYRFFVRNDAQAGEWIDVLITINDKEFEYFYPESGVLSSIGQIDNAVEVINEPTTKLDVDDADTQTAIASLETAVAAVETAIGTLESEVVEANTINLDGATMVNVSNSTTTVSAGTNTNGAIVEFCTYGQNSSSIGGLSVGGNIITPRNANSASGGVQGVVQKIKIPAGTAFAFVSPLAAIPISAAYRLL